MIKVRTHYDNLKVARNAPIEVIRAAYKTLSQKHHPDKNKNNNTDSDRVMKIINESYDVLSNADKRKRHDIWIVEQEGASGSVNNNQKNQQRSPHNSINIKPPEAGKSIFSELDSESKKNILERVSGKNENQYGVQLERVFWKYIWLLVSSSWFVYLIMDAGEYRWSEETSYWCIGLSFGAAVFLANNLAWVYSWHTTSLKSWLFVTPIYIIKTEFDKIWYWPIWSISDIKAIHNYKNGSYQDTSLSIHFDGKLHSFSISPESSYQFIVNRLQQFDGAFRTAISSNNTEYILANDDFKTLDQSEKNKFTSSRKPVVVSYIVSLLTASLIYAVAFQINQDQPFKPIYKKKPLPAYTSQQSKQNNNYVRPALTDKGTKWPTNASYVSGYKKLHTNGLSSVTVDNTRNSSDVFVKLVTLDGGKASPVRVFFIPARDQFKINKIRKGRYDIRYRDLSSGALARAEPFNLEETSNYDGTRYSNITMTLYKVRRGNMQTYKISESEF
ncbi:MAG: J domain-containing protein [Methylococcales bacterium]